MRDQAQNPAGPAPAPTVEPAGGTAAAPGSAPPGVLELGLSYAAYDHRLGLRFSALNRYVTSPNPTPASTDGSSAAQTLGRVVHALALQAEEAETVDLAVYAQAKAMAEAFRASPWVATLLDDAVLEGSIFFERSGIPCKARPDILKPSSVIDVKTTRSLTTFANEIEHWGYHRQLAWYMDAARTVPGWSPTTAYLIAIEKTAPYDVQLFRVTDAQLQVGAAQNAVALALFKRNLRAFAAKAEGGAP